MTNLNGYMTVKEAAKLLGISAMTLRRWDNGKKLKAKRHPINNYRLYSRKELEVILKEINKK
ncbi:MAG: helix-turn-helix domain-containing protein [Candidatus Omnitrophota bacterium]